ncbi:MAG: sulfite exporter TauE/SafE family protein [Nanoarchaeota archaeon]|nr:sulfite exporter TauE/SafE family protein [Nanoarchaeota archaeon]MBU1622487.1 sulfite exporter TauE/SafE family protein [Nanoarchaeota archaeon]
MTCNSCEKIIAKQAFKVDGVKSITVDYSTEKAEVSYDDEKTNLEEIKKAIEEKGYLCEENKGNEKSNKRGWIFGIIGIIIGGYFLLRLFDAFQLPEITQNMGYGLLFVVGLLTGFHCVSMCGGFVVSYTAKGLKEGKKTTHMHLSYGLGKTISYTVIGAAFGLLGSIIAFTPLMRGIAGIVAGLFLVLFGLKMLNFFPSLRKFQISLPKFINKFVGKESREHSNNPLVIGLLNGLMIACGPLQAIYIMAAGTGSMIEGAKLLFVFALGTLPVMLGFGYLTSFISKKSTYRILKASGAIVIILGLVMMNRGLALTGSGYDFNSLTAEFNVLNVKSASSEGNSAENSGLVFKDGYQEIRMEVNRYGWSPDKFVLKKGVPVKWIIDGKEINGCNNAIQVPKYGLKFEIKKGEQVIEFTPTEEGTVSWSCWMGMIPGVFVVKEDVDVNSVSAELNTVQVPKGGSCGAGGGGCGCGG